MNLTIKKGLRTLQSEFPFLKEAKEVFYYKMRDALSIPHERDFKALKYVEPRSNSVLVDIEANQGQSIESMSIYMPSSRIVSFEANSNLAEKLRARYKQTRRISIMAEVCPIQQEISRCTYRPTKDLCTTAWHLSTGRKQHPGSTSVQSSVSTRRS